MDTTPITRSHARRGPVVRHGKNPRVVQADGEGAYSVSEWWLDPNTTGAGAHAHPEDDAFYVLEGTMSTLVGTEWVDAPKGSFVLIPRGVTHDFENRAEQRAGVLNFFPGCSSR